MAISVDDIYQFTLNLMKKNQAGSLKSVAFERFWDDAQKNYQEDLLGSPSDKNKFNTGLLLNETILNKLAPFLKTISLSITNGAANKPADFIYKLSLRINNYPVYHVASNEIAYMSNDPLDPPDALNKAFYYTEYLGTYVFFPSNVTAATLDYISTPTPVKWAYKFDSNNRQVYDAINSVQPQWNDNDNRLITRRMFTNLGVPYKENDFENFGRVAKATSG